MSPFIKDVCTGHIIRKETDLHFGSDELHGHIIINPVNRGRGIPVDPADNPVHEAFVQPGPGFWHPCLHTGAAVAFQRDFPDPRVERGIIGADIVREEAVEFLQGMDGIQVKGIKPGFL